MDIRIFLANTMSRMIRINKSRVPAIPACKINHSLSLLFKQWTCLEVDRHTDSKPCVLLVLKPWQLCVDELSQHLSLCADEVSNLLYLGGVDETEDCFISSCIKLGKQVGRVLKTVELVVAEYSNCKGEKSHERHTYTDSTAVAEGQYTNLCMV